MVGKKGVDPAFFATAYKGQPPWDTGEPQPAIVRLAKAGMIRGDVLDVGCGSGDNALFLAEHGLDVLGVDFVKAAVDRAKAKARDRKLRNVTFRVADALKLSRLKRTFDTVIDSGLFHVFSDEDRVRYLQSLRSVMKPGADLFILCFSDKEKSKIGPRRLRKKEIEAAFGEGWTINAIRPTRFASNAHRGGAKAWLVSVTRDGHDGLPGMEEETTAASRVVALAAVGTVALMPAAAGATMEHAEINNPESIAADQRCPNWCWAAALEMLCRSQEVTIRQEVFVERIYGPELPCWPSGTLETIKVALDGDYTTDDGDDVRLTGAFHYGIPTNVAGMIKSIRDGRPFILGYQGHAYVAYGLWWMQRGNKAQVIQIDLIDPLWKLFPDRKKLTFFNIFQDPMWLINGTFELLVKQL